MLDKTASPGEMMIGLAGRALQLVSGAPLNILMYHAVVEEPLTLPDYCFIRAEEFSAQMEWLAARNVRVMSLVDAVKALEEKRLRGPTVVITFDDGYRNNVEVALPMLERHGFPATIYLTTGLTGTDRALWPSRLNLALMATRRDELDWRGNLYSLADIEARAAALPRLQEAVKQEAAGTPGDAVAEIERALDVPVDPSIPRESPFAMMDAADIGRAIDSGMIEFGGHTVTHPILSALDDARLETELDGSVDALEALTGRDCCSFAYPNGRSVDFDDRAVSRLCRRGVDLAVTTSNGTNRRSIDRMRLRRQGVGPAMNALRFAAASYGLPLEAWADAIRRR